ncbi:MAG: cation:proton antiporter [Pseudomonadota bacterium]
MDELSKTLLTLGSLMLLGMATDYLGRRTALPRVTLLLIFGVVIGPAVLDLLPAVSRLWFPVIADMALLMVGFLLGERLVFSFIRENGHKVLGISLAVVVTTMLVVAGGLLAVGASLIMVLLLAAIATATAPAATTDVVHELKADGPFTRVLLGIVAIDDAWGLIVFSFCLAAATTLSGGGDALTVVLHGMWELGGAVLLGLALGVPMAYLTGRIRAGEPTLAEALGLVFFCGGLALWLEVSFLLAAMVMGGTVANLAKHHQRPFHEIQHIEWPFMILFFVLAGAALNVDALLSVGIIGGAYIVLRTLSRLVGAWFGGLFTHANKMERRWMGAALMPQAGVALGMALVATQRIPELADTLLPIVISATVFFELVGPILTRLALKRAGEVGKEVAQ